MLLFLLSLFLCAESGTLGRGRIKAGSSKSKK